MEESKIYKTLIDAGISANLAGFSCIIEGCKLIEESPYLYVKDSKKLYEDISRIVGIAPASIEHSIRYAVSYGNADKYPVKSNKRVPSNMQFLFGLYYTLK